MMPLSLGRHVRPRVVHGRMREFAARLPIRRQNEGDTRKTDVSKKPKPDGLQKLNIVGNRSRMRRDAGSRQDNVRMMFVGLPRKTSNGSKGRERNRNTIVVPDQLGAG